MWLPSVIASTPPANNARAVFGVIPSPPATFSPLTITNVGWKRSRRIGRHSSSVRRPTPPTRSPTNRMLACVEPYFADDRGQSVATVQRTVVPRWVQLVLLPLSLLALYALAKAAGKVLLISSSPASSR